MFSKAFWAAAIQRMIRAGAAATFATFFVGDFVFDVMNLNTWTDFFTVFVGAAVGSLVLSLAGDVLTPGNGPAFGSVEQVGVPAPPAGQ